MRLLAVFLLLGACAEKPPADDVIIPPTTKPTDEATRTALTDYNTDDGVMRFSRSTGVLDSLEVGDILVSTVAPPAAPDGFLRKVTAIDRSGGQVTLQTVQGTLGEAIEKATINVEKMLTMDDIVSIKPASSGVTVDGDPFSSAGLIPDVWFDRGLNLRFTDFLLPIKQDPADDTSPVSGQIGFNGHLRFNPVFNFELVIRNFHMEHFRTTLQFEGDSDLAIFVQLQLALDRSKRFLQIDLTKIFVQVGPVTVVLVPVLRFFVGVRGNVAVDLSFHEVGAYDGTSGRGYDDATGWVGIQSGSSSGTIDGTPVGHFSAALEVYARIEAEVLIYGSFNTGPLFYVDFGPRLDFQTPRHPFLQAGLHLMAGIALHLYIFGWEYGRTTIPYLGFDRFFPIFSSPNTPPELAVTSPMFSSCAPDYAVHFQAAVYDLEDGVSVPTVWTSDLDGVIGTGADFISSLHPRVPGLRHITVTSTDSNGEPRSVMFPLTLTNSGAVPVLARPVGGRSIFNYPQTVLGSATHAIFPGEDLCTLGFAFEFSSTEPSDTFSPVRCSQGSASATLTAPSPGPRTLTLAVTDPFNVRQMANNYVTVVARAPTDYGNVAFNSPGGGAVFGSASPININASADPRPKPGDPSPFKTEPPLTLTYTATSYAADNTTELQTVEIGSMVETDANTAGTGASPPLVWIPASVPGFIDPAVAAMGGGQKVVLSVVAADNLGHYGTSVVPIQVTP